MSSNKDFVAQVQSCDLCSRNLHCGIHRKRMVCTVLIGLILRQRRKIRLANKSGSLPDARNRSVSFAISIFRCYGQMNHLNNKEKKVIKDIKKKEKEEPTNDSLDNEIKTTNGVL